ncbi:type II toxin-antitoxin system VapC family toxin [Dolichospermum sp. LEGE 00240]|uniref:type II toxin-antitoxin system VapC family toxin n=1 Tax=Dolichospermum sp. LEGE 00240 TaxID=1828603 RepID=UPI00187F33C1|nr:type II toxin-antitoxin system VapC family toxin [Dolichospermum sp. LEGE 00240]MBE9250069.1 type II toxin-antitoxin system VapC family toxin [Dolichospermum sp. LEGE 00240]MDM3852701.1 type II toxin-antitoxin system VapC family toxin [Aphanizomenon gracile PMC627.10]MDM3854842.1 type II toxin-antitoxin system VapC family toxin [Aphanizomenon gracile PMC649.10]MDM3859084.1 type II toxin-antitoxin system VapC family toxin [Aphanizomenon gracile PMC644.10]
MKPALIDTNILSFFFRNQSLVIERFQAYLKEYDKINISIITYYEIVSGLKHRDAQKQLTSFQEFVSYNTVLPLTTSSAIISADIYANLRSKGTPIDDIDILIAGIAIANDLIIVTNNTRDFGKIENLEIVRSPSTNQKSDRALVKWL